MARIAFVSDVAYPWTKGGMEAMHHIEMRELAKKHEVYCFCLRFEGMKDEFYRNGVHYVTVAKASTSELYTARGTRSIALAMRFARALPKALKPYGSFDLVYANSFPFTHLSYLKGYCKQHACKLVLDVAEVWDARRWKEYIGSVKGAIAYYYAKSALKGADHYIANSSTTASLLEGIGIPDGSITVFSPVIDMHSMRRFARGKRSKAVVYSGRLIKEKRLDLWVEMLAKAHELDTGIRGVIVGSGPEEQHIRELIRRYQFISMRKPYQSKAPLYRLIGGSMAMLNMSEREGLSVITIESAALGTAPILPSYSPIPSEVKALSIVREVRDIPRTIADIASGKIKYKTDAKALEGFDASRVNSTFARLLA